MEQINKLMTYLRADKTKANAFEMDYILFQYTPQNLDEKAIIDKASNNILSYSIAGACVGLSLSLSLRRYLPEAFGEISLKRCILDAFLTLTGYSVCSNLGMELALQQTQEVRKNLVLSNNLNYLEHIRRKVEQFPSQYRNEDDVYKEIFDEQEYNEWIQQRK